MDLFKKKTEGKLRVDHLPQVFSGLDCDNRYL